MIIVFTIIVFMIIVFMIIVITTRFLSLHFIACRREIKTKLFENFTRYAWKSYIIILKISQLYFCLILNMILLDFPPKAVKIISVDVAEAASLQLSPFYRLTARN